MNVSIFGLPRKKLAGDSVRAFVLLRTCAVTSAGVHAAARCAQVCELRLLAEEPQR
jgi:hypothetical protein